MANAISIRGTREGLTIALGDGELDSLLAELVEQLRHQEGFFRGGIVALHVGARELGVGELGAVKNLLEQHDMVLRTVVTTNRATQQAVKDLGLRLVVQSAGGQRREGAASAAVSGVSPVANVLREERAILVRRRVRSGQVVQHTGHVVVIGDVNVGGEIVAGGDILVWGCLAGTAHAGYQNNRSAVICALDLRPVQLRIGDLVARPGEGHRATRLRPEMAYVRRGTIVVEPWDQGRRGE